jgi:hypothetical protein
MRAKRAFLFGLALSALLFFVIPLAAWSGAMPTASQVADCPTFPFDNVWNARVDSLPVHANSSTWVGAIGSSTGLHPDFGSGDWPPGSGMPIGIPYTTVLGTQTPVTITYAAGGYPGESDPGPFPIPPNAPIEGGNFITNTGDRHVLVVDRDNCLLYELYNAWKQSDNSWQVYQSSKFDLRSNALRPASWTSADAAGLPIFAGLARYDEIVAGELKHALRFTVDGTNNSHVWPARHSTSYHYSASKPPMGARFRLKTSYAIPANFSLPTKIILTALKKYGMIVADNGGNWFISGAPDPNWDDGTLVTELSQVIGSNLEAVDESAWMVDSNSGRFAVKTFFLPALFRP